MEQQREIVFKDITTGEVTHTTLLNTAGVADYRSVIGYFAQTIMKELRLVSDYDVLFGKIKAFVQTELFNQRVDLEHPNTLRNLSELAATKTLIETFKKAINALTVRDRGDAEIRDTIKLRQTRPFVVKDQGYLIPKKSVFNRVIGDNQLELLFASFLEDLSGRGVLREKLLRGPFQAGLRQCGREHLQLLPGFPRQARGCAYGDCRNQGAGRHGRAAQDAAITSIVRGRQSSPVRR